MGKITESQLRRIIREELLNEASKQNDYTKMVMRSLKNSKWNLSTEDLSRIEKIIREAWTNGFEFAIGNLSPNTQNRGGTIKPAFR